VKTKLAILALLAASAVFAQSQVSIGIGIGNGGYGPGYYAPPPAYGYVPPYPGPGYQWVDGYWGPAGWIAGYWYRPVLRPGYRVYGYRYNAVPFRGYAGGYRNFSRGWAGNRGPGRHR